MKTLGRGEKVPIPAPGEEEAKVGEEQLAPTGIVGPEQRAPAPPQATDQVPVTSPVPSSVEAPVGPTEVNTAAPEPELSLDDIEDPKLPGGSRKASQIIQGLNAGLEIGPESGRPQE